MVKSNNQPLQIRLTEPVIFLKGPSTGLDFRGRPQTIAADAQPAMLRGLLTLRLSKPTRIRKIEIKLEGKTRTEWPEGIGPRRMDTGEEHVLIAERTTYFNAIRGESKNDPRRTASVGPGIMPSQWDLDEEYFDESPTPEPARFAARSASAMPGNEGSRDVSRRQSVEGLYIRDLSLRERGPSPAYTPRSESPADGRQRSNLRSSILSPIASAAPSRATSDRDDSTSTERRRTAPSRRSRGGFVNEPLIESSNASSDREEETRVSAPASILDNTGGRGGEVRFAAELPTSELPSGRAASVRTMNSQHSTSSDNQPTESHPIVSGIQTAANSPGHSPAPSLYNSRDMRGNPSSASLAEGENNSGNDSSRRSSLLEGVSSSGVNSPGTPPNQEVRKGRKTRIGSASTIVINNDMPGPSRPTESRQNSERSVSSAHAGGHDDGHEERRNLKFSLASAFGVVKDRMSSRSRTRNSSRAPSRAASRGPSRAPSIDESSGIPPSMPVVTRGGSGSGFARVPSAVPLHLDDERTNRFQGREDFVPGFGRGGAGRSVSTNRTASPGRRDMDRSPSRNRGRNKGMKVLTEALGVGDHQEDDEAVHNWIEFKKGVYNYPISFPIPVDSPPTLHAEFGSVVYRLKATVVRVGALTSNLVEETEVTMIATPQEDDLEETENVIVERQWEEQMRYQIALHGKAFPIGGIIPLSIRLMPLMKCKIHRLTVSLEEKTDYFAQEKRVARHETPKKFTLLFIKQPEKLERLFPLLPIISDDPNAAKESPVAQLAAQAAVNNPAPDAFDPENEDSMYATLLDPLGPWHLEKNLQIPDCASTVKFTSKHEKTNITVGHWLKVTIRVERGDDVAVDSKGRRKQFDIIIETPIKLLDCRVNPQINSLPTYTSSHPTSAAAPGTCSFHSSQARQFTPIASSRQTDDPLVSSAPGSGTRFERGEPTRGRTRDAHPANHEEDTLLERNIVYDRLMSGQETETGELPPSYGEAVANAIRSASRSQSRSNSHSRYGSVIEYGGVREGRSRDGRERSSRSRSRLRDLEMGLSG